MGVEYKIGQEPVVSIIPKPKVKPGQVTVAVGPNIDHIPYLKSSNRGQHAERFGGNSFAQIELPDDGTEIFTIPSSSYVEGPESMHTMLVAVNTNRKGKEKSIPSFRDFKDAQGQAHFALLAKTAGAMTERYGTQWFMGTSINPDEWSRQAVQSVKTIHTHIIGMKREHLIPFSELSPQERAERRKTLADSGTSLGIALLHDLVFTPDFWNDPEIAGLVVDENVLLDMPYPKGYTFALPGSEAIGDPRFFALTKKIDERMRSEYRDLADVFTEKGIRDPLKRPVLRPPEERTRKLNIYSRRKNIPFNTYQRLASLSSNLRSAVEEVGLAGDDVNKQIYRANTRLFLKGRAYNHMIFPDHDGSGRILVSIVPRSLSGGSPLDAMGIFKDQYLADPSVVEQITRRQKQVAEEVLGPVLNGHPTPIEQIIA